MKHDVLFRQAQIKDLSALLALEDICFATDKLSKRQFKHWIKAKHGIFIVAVSPDLDTATESVVGYGLVITRKGTSLARLYSLAVNPQSRGLGIAKRLIEALEVTSVDHQKLFLRLEVSTKNTQAINLYKGLGYKTFGHYTDYYEDHNDALRMQKAIYQQASQKRMKAYPYYQQTTPFTCGSAALMMAMAKLDESNEDGNGNSSKQSVNEQGAHTLLNQSQELAIWRQATTIFMTSGHGGSHPLGLAIAAISRGFKATVYINQSIPLFLAGVRDAAKKQVLAQVEQDFLQQAESLNTHIVYADFTPDDIQKALSAGKAVLCLISSYQFDGYKGPHWVTLTHIDDEFLYLHDPDEIDEDKVGEVPTSNADRQHIPVSLTKFDRYTCYGKAKLRTAIVIERI